MAVSWLLAAALGLGTTNLDPFETPGVDQAGPVCQPRTEVVLDQETYKAVTDRIYVFTGDIRSSGSNYQPFQVHVLVGQYRRPFLLPTGGLNERDFKTLFANRSDLQRTILAVNAPSTRESVNVKDGNRTIAIRVVRVVPSRGGTDRVVLEACG